MPLGHISFTIYDDYCDDMYAIKKDNHETCHRDFSFQLDYASHDSYFVEFGAPTIPNEKNFSYVESSRISMRVDHEIMLYVLVILLNSSMMLLKIIMREEHMLLYIAIISSFLSMCLKS